MVYGSQFGITKRHCLLAMYFQGIEHNAKKQTHKVSHNYRKLGIEQGEKSQQVSIAEKRSYCYFCGVITD